MKKLLLFTSLGTNVVGMSNGTLLTNLLAPINHFLYAETLVRDIYIYVGVCIIA